MARKVYPSKYRKLYGYTLDELAFERGIAISTLHGMIQRGEFSMAKPGKLVTVCDLRPPARLIWWKRLLGFKQPQPARLPEMSKYELFYFVEFKGMGVTKEIESHFYAVVLPSCKDATLVLIDTHQISVLRNRR